ncbi:hypothetical protein LMG33818_001676 [Halomonadaceae bacterium LMG 33818]|uniref:hypothetical protein n=1 Tax=Cernens ardua TaxID=3402176 RepID=UPI003EDBFACA
MWNVGQLFKGFKLPIATAVGVTAVAIAGCSGHGNPPPPDAGPHHVDQSSICVAATNGQAAQCPEGKLFLAQLNAPVNGQAPSQSVVAARKLNTIALFCNTNYPIQDVGNGLICVITHQRHQIQTPGAGAPQQNQQPAQQQAPATPDNNSDHSAPDHH